MVSEACFVIRKSGRRENSFYIDYQGSYKITEISKIVGMKESLIVELYESNQAELEKELDVYYFPDVEKAKDAIRNILSHVKPDRIGRNIYLTDQEIEYIRQALINESGNTIKITNKTKDAILKKLNEI